MSQKNQTVRGYVVELPSSKREGSDEEDEDDDEDNWLDYSQIKNAFDDGTFVKQYKKPRYCRVAVKDLENAKQTHSCFGRFVLLDPWWELTVTFGPDKRVRGLTQYRVRQDEEGIVSQNLVPFLLSTALRKHHGGKHDDQLMKQVDDFVRKQRGQKLLFEDIDPMLYQFIQAHPENKRVIMQARQQDTLQGVLRGLRHPDLLQFLCRLFPLSFLSCLVSPMQETLTGLELAAEKEPWVFGFRAIMTLKFKVFNVEANYKAFETCGLMGSIPPMQKNALYIYEVLKADASRYGHTYISFTDLRQHRHWVELKHDVDDWGPALTFLTENGVTKEERFDGGRNVFLYHNWKAEEDIASGLKEVMDRGALAKRPTWTVDFASEDLSRLRGDADQWLAAQKVAGSPICIMSGKGGCGKTTVVTQVVQHVCQTAPVVEEKMDDIDDILANADLQEVFGAKADGTKPGSSQVAPPQLSQMIDTTTQSLKERQTQDQPFSSSQEKRKRDQIQVDMTTDLIKFLGTTGNTALSRTANGRKMLLTAPTGKAAKLLGHKAKMESCTLHGVIYSYRAFVKEQKRKQMEEKKAGWEDAQNKKEQGEENSGPSDDGGENASQDKKDGNTTTTTTENQSENEAAEGVWKHARTEVLIVDECSLVSLRTFATLLNILIENTPLWKIVLLGDVRQLPSIEAGNFLGDVFSTFRERGLSVELRTNHRSESELIVSNATRISRRQLPVIDPGRHFHFMAIEDTKDSADPERDAAVRGLLSNRPELLSHETSQFVSFRRVDCEAINELCCKHYNQHQTREAKESSAKQPFDFRVGDKICFRKNGQVFNHGVRLRGYLQDYPYILEAFGITAKKADKKEKKKKNMMDVTAAVEEVLTSNEDEDGEGKRHHQQFAADQLNKTRADRKAAESDPSCCRLNVTGSDPNGSLSQRPSQMRTTANVSTLAAPCGQLSLDDIGAEDSVAGKAGSSQDGGQPGASQDKDDEEEEQAGKLKNGLVRLCNGEVFFIMDDVREVDEKGKESRFLTLSDRDPECPRVVCASLPALKRECRIRHAWARTIHTYQGSESDTVVYFVGESIVQNWKHVYTAVTRGRKSVIMVGKESELRQSVSRTDRPRRSRLSRRLQNMMKDLPFQDLHAMMRTINEQAKAAMHPPTPHPPTQASSLTSDGRQNPPDTPAPPHTSLKQPAIDPFPDSDDSWVRDMSPVWSADYVASTTPAAGDGAGAYRTNLQDSPDLYQDDDGHWDLSPVAKAAEQGGEGSAGKRQQQQTLGTPKRLCTNPDPIDSIVSPVRRTLNF